MRKLSRLKIMLFLFGLSMLPASGTFVYQSPPKPRQILDQNVVELGKGIFEKTNDKGLSCSSCHAKKSEYKFRRRKLSKIINDLQGNIKKCSVASDRMSLSQTITATDESLEALKLYIAQQWKVLDYIR